MCCRGRPITKINEIVRTVQTCGKGVIQKGALTSFDSPTTELAYEFLWAIFMAKRASGPLKQIFLGAVPRVLHSIIGLLKSFEGMSVGLDIMIMDRVRLLL